MDGTNTRTGRRRAVETFFQENMKIRYKLIWIESICHIKDIIEKNIFKTKINSPDYKHWEDHDKAAEDFRNRINEYEKVYEKVSIENDGENSAFIQIINQGEKLIVRNVKGYVESKIISYIANLHTGDRPIYFLRDGETEFSKLNLIGGDSPLSETGYKFANLSSDFFSNENKDWLSQKPEILCSTMKSACQTADKLKFLNNYKTVKSLDEMNTGLRDGMSKIEVKSKFPEEEFVRNSNKLVFRYPRGESYMDVLDRIEPIIFEIERIKNPVIIVAHLKILRCLYGYFAGVPLEIIPDLAMPRNTIIKFVPDAYGYYEMRYKINVETGDITKDDKSFIQFPDYLVHTPD